MSRNYLFQNNKRPKNYQIIANPDNKRKLIATKLNSELSQIVHILVNNPNETSTVGNGYTLYNWNTTSDLITLNFVSKNWDCSAKCELTASGTFLLVEDQKFSYLYIFDSKGLINKLLTSYPKNRIPILDQSRSIRKKSDISKKYYIYASGKDLVAISYANQTLIMNVFPLPLIYNFNPNNFVLDTKLYQSKLYVLYRSISTYNIYLYEFNQVQLLFQKYPNNTKLNQTGIVISQVFRFNNNYISKVIRFVRGVDIATGNMIIWVYNENQAYKCANSPCIGYGYQIYNNIVFSSVTATNYTIAFYGKSNLVELKSFKPSLVSQQIGRYYFDQSISITDILSYSNYTITKLLISSSGSLFPTVYTLTNECKTIKAFEQQNFCRCLTPYIYDPTSLKCVNTLNVDSSGSIDNIYIAFIAIIAILFFTLVFIIYKKFIVLKKVRKSWQYNVADNIIFQ